MTPLLSLPLRRFSPKRYRPGNLGTWSGHLPFASDLVHELQPSLLVELGTHYGESYFGFCQAVEESGADCRCFAVDTWRGDAHAGFYEESVYAEVNEYNQQKYARFSTLVRRTFDEASAQFAPDSIDLLHIDGLHTYEAVKQDFETWFPKVKPGGVVLLHDINVRHANFEVWRLWEELTREYRHFSFLHWWGLGVLLKPGGREPLPAFLQLLCEADSLTSEHIRDCYNDAADLLNFRERSQNSQGAAEADRPYLQVFPAMADAGYVEKESVVVNLEAGVWQSHLVELSKGAPGGSIRIDPVNTPAWIEISALTVRNRAGTESFRLEGAGLSAFHGLKQIMRLGSGETPSFFSWGNDPQFVFDLPDSMKTTAPLTLELDMRVTFNLEGVRDILLSQKTPELYSGWESYQNLQSQISLLQTELAAASAQTAQVRAELSEWSAHSTGLRATLTREESIRTRLEWDLTFAKTQLRDRGKGASILEDKLASAATREEQLNRMLLARRTEADRLRQEIAWKDAAILNLQNLAAVQEARVEGLTDSLSWRLTAPLRTVAGSFLKE